MSNSKESPTASPRVNSCSLPFFRTQELIEKVQTQDGILSPTDTKELADRTENLLVCYDRLSAQLRETQDDLAVANQLLQDFRHTHAPFLT